MAEGRRSSVGFSSVSAIVDERLLLPRALLLLGGVALIKGVAPQEKERNCPTTRETQTLYCLALGVGGVRESP